MFPLDLDEAGGSDKARLADGLPVFFRDLGERLSRRVQQVDLAEDLGFRKFCRAGLRLSRSQGNGQHGRKSKRSHEAELSLMD